MGLGLIRLLGIYRYYVSVLCDIVNKFILPLNSWSVQGFAFICRIFSSFLCMIILSSDICNFPFSQTPDFIISEFPLLICVSFLSLFVNFPSFSGLCWTQWHTMGDLHICPVVGQVLLVRIISVVTSLKCAFCWSQLTCQAAGVWVETRGTVILPHFSVWGCNVTKTIFVQHSGYTVSVF